MSNEPQVNVALDLVNQLIPLVSDAESKLASARNWGFLDVLGGGFIVDLIKHSKLNSASNTMSEVNYLMQQLQKVLGSIQFPVDYSMQVGGFSTFADFFFDSGIVDIYMTSKIMSSLTEVRKLKDKLYSLKGKLENYR